MSQRPFRFLHAADLHLDQPVSGLSEAPSHLVDLLVDCPLRSAVRMFDAAIEHQVDFVLLAGDVADPGRCAPRECLFLVEQFQRLAERNISVYWCGGGAEAIATWPSFVRWPPNVRIFPAGRVERCQHEIAGVVVCEILGRSDAASGEIRPYEFAPGPSDPFSIALAHSNFNAVSLGELGINYWALGGPHERATPLDVNCVVHTAGSPQGRRPDEAGPHGCTLVSVDEQSRARLTLLSCDVMRFQSAQLLVNEPTDRYDIEKLLFERTARLGDESPGVTLLVSWNIVCSRATRSALLNGTWGTELTAKLRSEFGYRTPAIWTIGIDAELPEETPKSWYDEENLRGEFLRSVQRCCDGEGESSLSLPTCDDVPADFRDRLQLAALLESRPARRQLLAEVAWLGASLLSPEEAAR